MKRVAILCEYSTLNGGERSILAAVDRMAGPDFEFVFLAPPTGRLADALQAKNYQHRPLCLQDPSGNRLPRAEASAAIVAEVQRCAPDLVHANSLSMGRLTGAIAENLHVPCSAHLRDILRLSKAAIADLNRNRRLLAVSRVTQEFHVNQGLDPARVSVLYNGVDCDQFQPRPRTAWLRNELGLAESDFLIATIGQIGLRKGQDVLAVAASMLAQSLPHTHYLLVGERNSQKSESLEFEANLIASFQKPGLSDRLHRLGYRNDVDRLLNEVDLLVHPAHQEPLGRVLLEAAASGLPIIATDVGGTAEILTDGESARLIPPRDPRALAAAISELHDDCETRARLATCARREMLARFQIEQAAQNLATIWNEL